MTVYEEKECPNCKSMFVPKQKKVKFCCILCSQKYHTGENHPLYKNGTISNGYRLLPQKGKRVFEHRLVMEESLGRKLLDTEVVHHIDGNKLNNSIDNLRLFANQSEHAKVPRLIYNELDKECGTCHAIKLYKDFPRNRFTRDGYMTKCYSCTRKYDNELARRKRLAIPLP